MRKVLYILGELEDRDLQSLLELGRPERAPEGRPVLRAGAIPEHLFIVLDGELVVRQGAREIARIGPGELIGEMSLIDRRAPAVTVEATRATLLFAIPNDDLRERLEADPPFAARFYRATCIFLANRLHRTDLMLGRGRTLGDPDVEDSISPSALERVALAGARYQWFARRVRAAERA